MSVSWALKADSPGGLAHPIDAVHRGHVNMLVFLPRGYRPIEKKSLRFYINGSVLKEERGFCTDIHTVRLGRDSDSAGIVDLNEHRLIRVSWC